MQANYVDVGLCAIERCVVRVRDPTSKFLGSRAVYSITTATQGINDL